MESNLKRPLKQKLNPWINGILNCFSTTSHSSFASLSLAVSSCLFLPGSILRAADLSPSDPALVPPPPHYAIGFPSQKENLDVLSGFQKPPAGYGEVAFFWWMGDPLTRERLAWQLARLAGKGVMGLQINYAHSDKGGKSYGLTYKSEPRLFSEKWWDLVHWFCKESRKKGMAVSLSDYTLGCGQGWAVDDAIKAYPEIAGAELRHKILDAASDSSVDWAVPGKPLALRAYRWHDGRISDGGTDLLSYLSGGKLVWKAPSDGPWKLVAVWPEKIEPSVNPMHPQSGKAIIEKFFQPFENRNPGEAGKALNFFFSDELDFRVRGNLWDAAFASEFHKRKGYDIESELPSLFLDTGDRTPKVRLDYNDVVVALSEENYFRPVFLWHQERGMIYGCDHGGRGRDVTEFGDYFRTQRWNQGPGSDQPGLARDLIKAKVASSMSHLYLRPRVWIEGYYGSGWGTSSAQLTDATIANFLQGYNLLTLHGLYYSTRGGWWEWAPPCNHWRMPYWEHMGVFMGCVQRLSYLLSQGTHVCDVAVIYPVAPMEAGMDGNGAVNAAFSVGETLYHESRDFDFMDFQSLERSEIKDGRLNVSGESYRVLVLPAMKAMRHSTLQKAAQFARQGGIVIAMHAPPEATDRLGRNDPEVERLSVEIFGMTAQDAMALKAAHRKEQSGGGIGAIVQTLQQASELVASSVPADIALSKKPPTSYMHRRIGSRDVYALYGVPAGSEGSFRSTGQVELWDPWTGKTSALSVLEQKAGTTRLRLPLESSEVQLIVFSSGKALIDQGLPKPKTTEIPLNGSWTCLPKPTMDNRWGDFRIPASEGCIGVEACSFRYHEETPEAAGWKKPDFEDSAWRKITCAYGEKFMKLGPIPVGADNAALEAKLLATHQISVNTEEKIGALAVPWKPYEFSWQYGVENDSGHQGYHGLKERMYDEFIRLGKLNWQMPRVRHEVEPEGTRYYLWTTVAAPRDMQGVTLWGGLKPTGAWINGKAVRVEQVQVSLKAGANPVLLRYDTVGTGYFLIVDASSSLGKSDPSQISSDAEERETTGTLSMRWHGQEGILPFDVRPDDAKPAGWYRFKAPPGVTALKIADKGDIRCWVNGLEVTGNTKSGVTRFALSKAVPGQASIALRIGQSRGEYGASAISSPIEFECGEGELNSGDWSQVEGLAAYSGGMYYRKKATLSKEQLQGRVILDLGEVVSSAEVRINGKPAGIRVAPPWRFDIAKQLQSGENGIEVLVYNTLGNHYLNIPTHYRGQIRSGLIGPVSLRIEEKANPAK